MVAAIVETGDSSPKPAFGAFKRPTAPLPTPKQEAVIDDPRHDDNSSPMPWLRYFFPKDFDLREGAPTDPYYQYFDVRPQTLLEDTAIPPPPWAPNAYFQLSFTQLHLPPGATAEQLLATRLPRHDAPPPTDAIDLTHSNANLLLPGNEQLLEGVVAFARSIATFRARTWKDAFPLVDLLRGVLSYLLDHYTWGVALLRERAKQDAEAALAAEKAALKAWYQSQLEEVAAKARQEYDTKLEAMREQLRMTLAEDLTRELRAERDEKEKLRAQMAALEAQLRKAAEANAVLERQVAHLQHQAEQEAARTAAALAARDGRLEAAREEADGLRARLAAAQRCVADALNARTKDEALDVAMSAIGGSLGPGCGAYLAELRTAGDADDVDPAAALAAEVAAVEAAFATGAPGGTDGDQPSTPGGASSVHAAGGLPAAVVAAVHSLSPGLLTSPLAALVGHGVEAGAPHRPSTPGDSGSSLQATLSLAASSEVKETLVFKYVKATADQRFMLGQRLPWGTGASWELVEGASAVHLPDVSADPRVHFFRPLPAAAHSGVYFAVPIIGRSGEVCGMMCVDTVAAAAASAARTSSSGSTDGSHGALRDTDRDFLQRLAAAVSTRVQADQETFAEAMLELALVSAEADHGADAPAPAVDPEQYAGEGGLTGALKVFKEALDVLRNLSDEDLEALRSLDSPDDVTLAVLKSVLGAVGQLSAESDWAAIRQHLTRDLLNQLVGLDPQAAWAEWQALCRAFRPVNELGGGGQEALGEAGSAAEDAAAPPATRAGGAFARWVTAVRQISAACALQGLLEAKLQKANAALIKTFSGDGCNALTELRSYRVPPPITFATLQCVLMLSGHGEDDCANWARMRTLTTYKLIKRLITLRPAQVSRKVFKAVRKLVGQLGADDVRKESVATLGLYRWLSDFTRLASVA